MDLIKNLFVALIGRRRREDAFLLDMMTGAAKGNCAEKLRSAVSAISRRPLHKAFGSELVGLAAAELVRATIEPQKALENSQGRVAAGLFALAYANSLSFKLGTSFEEAGALAYLDLVRPIEFDAEFPVLVAKFNEMTQRRSTITSSAASFCSAWYDQPTPDNLARLKKAFEIVSQA